MGNPAVCHRAQCSLNSLEMWDSSCSACVHQQEQRPFVSSDLGTASQCRRVHPHDPIRWSTVLKLLASADPVTGVPPYVRTFSCTTAVRFDILSDDAIQAYIATGDFDDGLTRNALMWCPTATRISQTEGPCPVSIQ